MLVYLLLKNVKHDLKDWKTEHRKTSYPLHHTLNIAKQQHYLGVIEMGIVLVLL